MESNFQLLDVEDLSVEIPTARGIVRPVAGVSFRMSQGETLGIVGESGSGKSMLAMSLMRLVPRPGHIAGGAIRFEGRDLINLSERAMRQIRGNQMGMIFQDPTTSLNPVHRIGYQVGETISAHQRLSRRVVHARSIEMLRSVRIPEPEFRARLFPHQYSGGMRQRVMIAIGTANRPGLLIADEPTTALDVTVQAQIMELLGSLNRETQTAIILITHNIALVSQFCRRVLVMYAGRIVEAGPTSEVFDRPQHPYTSLLLRAVPVVNRRLPEGLTTIEGRPPDLAHMPTGCSFNPRCPVAEEVCRAYLPRLETVEEGRSVRCWIPMNAPRFQVAERSASPNVKRL